MHPENGRQKVVAAIADLFFMVKVKDAATAAGFAVEFAKSKDDTLARVAAGGVRLVVVDLHNAACAPLELIAALADTGVETLGFVSHVNSELREMARQAGATRVMARSAFAGNLRQIFVELQAGAE